MSNLNNTILSLTDRDNIISKQLYSIVSFTEVVQADFNSIFTLQPLVFKQLIKPPNENMIDTFYFYKTDMLKSQPIHTVEQKLTMSNIYTDIPLLVQSFINSNTYITGLTNYKEKNIQLKCTDNANITNESLFT